jgi:hypothetical protein
MYLEAVWMQQIVAVVEDVTFQQAPRSVETYRRTDNAMHQSYA